MAAIIPSICMVSMVVVWRDMHNNVWRHWKFNGFYIDSVFLLVVALFISSPIAKTDISSQDSVGSFSLDSEGLLSSPSAWCYVRHSHSFVSNRSQSLTLATSVKRPDSSSVPSFLIKQERPNGPWLFSTTFFCHSRTVRISHPRRKLVGWLSVASRAHCL